MLWCSAACIDIYMFFNDNVDILNSFGVENIVKTSLSCIHNFIYMHSYRTILSFVVLILKRKTFYLAFQRFSERILILYWLGYELCSQKSNKIHFLEKKLIQNSTLIISYKTKHYPIQNIIQLKNPIHKLIVDLFCLFVHTCFALWFCFCCSGSQYKVTISEIWYLKVFVGLFVFVLSNMFCLWFWLVFYCFVLFVCFCFVLFLLFVCL